MPFEKTSAVGLPQLSPVVPASGGGPQVPSQWPLQHAAPLEQVWPLVLQPASMPPSVPPSVVPPVHAPLALHVAPPVHATHEIPPLPHAFTALPVWQPPSPPMHPAQLGSLQTLLMHDWVSEQTAHALPPVPQAPSWSPG